MNDTIYHDGSGGFETGSFRESKAKVELSAEIRLKALFETRKKLCKKGGNDEKLNEKIRSLQRETGYKILE